MGGRPKGQTPGGADPVARDALVPLLANGTNLLQGAADDRPRTGSAHQLVLRFEVHRGGGIVANAPDAAIR